MSWVILTFWLSTIYPIKVALLAVNPVLGSILLHRFPTGITYICIDIILYEPMHTHPWLKSNSHNPFSSILRVFVKSRLPPVSSNMAGWRISIVRLFQVAIDFGDFPTFALWYPLVKQHSYWTWPFILDLPNKHGDLPYPYAKVYQRYMTKSDPRTEINQNPSTGKNTFWAERRTPAQRPWNTSPKPPRPMPEDFSIGVAFIRSSLERKNSWPSGKRLLWDTMGESPCLLGRFRINGKSHW